MFRIIRILGSSFFLATLGSVLNIFLFIMVIAVISGCRGITPETSRKRFDPELVYALVVDDIKIVRTKVKKFLELQGFSVIQAATKRQAIDAVKNYPIRAIITDLDLSKTGNFFLSRNDGVEFLKWLEKEQKAGRYSTLTSVILHSTIFNENDPWGALIPGYKRRVRELITNMGYHVQPKTVILDESLPE